MRAADAAMTLRARLLTRFISVKGAVCCRNHSCAPYHCYAVVVESGIYLGRLDRAAHPVEHGFEAGA